MPSMYDNKITSAEPTLMVFLIDQSASMSETMVKTEQGEPYSISRIAKIISDTFLYDAFRRCMRGNVFKPYIDLAVIGYGTNQPGTYPTPAGIHSALPQIPLEQFPFSVTKLADAVIKKNDINPDVVPLVPKPKLEWIEERADSNVTPMLAAFTKAKEIVEKWLPDHQTSFPPIVINISDGAPNDDPSLEQKYQEAGEKGWTRLGDISQTSLIMQSKAIQDIGTDNGKCLVLNAHISASEARHKEIFYPSSVKEAENIDSLAKIMFEMSSTIPDSLHEYGTKTMKIPLEPNARFFVFNADITSLLTFMQFGTSQANLGDDGGSNTSSLPSP